MRSFEDLPIEVQEHIFFKLNAKDLMQCSLVSLKWREIINSNRIWMRMCEMNGIADSRCLRFSDRSIQNPIKQYTNALQFAPLCHWKEHFNRYRYLRRNWETGRYVKIGSFFKPFYMSEDFIVEISNLSLKIFEIRGAVTELSVVQLEFPEDLDNFVSNGQHIVYTQRRQMICLKKHDGALKNVFQIELVTENCCHFRPCRTTMLDKNILISLQFILVLNPAAPCCLTFYSLSEPHVSRKFDLHQVLKNPKRFSRNCCEVVGDKVFLCYNSFMDSFMLRYDYVKDAWDLPIALDFVAVAIFSSKRFICVKMASEDEDTPVSFWECSASTSPIHVSTLTVSEDSPIFITSDDFAIFFIHQEIFIKGLIKDRVHSFSVPLPVIDFRPVLDKYMVVLCADGVSVWDCERGLKLYTPFREEIGDFTTMDISLCVSNTNIFLKFGRHAEGISYW